jgi:hypothetical protein
MKRLEREMKGENANATDDEVGSTYTCEIAKSDICRTMFSRPPILTSHITLTKIASAQSSPHVAEPMSRLTESLRMTAGGSGSILPGPLSSQRTKMQMTRLKMRQRALLGLLALTVMRLSLTTT